MKNFYIAVQACHNGKYYAYMLKVNPSVNLFCRLSGVQGITAANIFPTRKECGEVVQMWNAEYMREGRYMFSEPQF